MYRTSWHCSITQHKPLHKVFAPVLSDNIAKNVPLLQRCLLMFTSDFWVIMGVLERKIEEYRGGYCKKERRKG